MWIKRYILFTVLLMGCAGTPTYLYLVTHPDFAPLVPMESKAEYQVVWYRSWHPTIYLKAHLEHDELGDLSAAFIEYAKAEDKVPKLERKRISLEDWYILESVVTTSRFWTEEYTCEQLSYRKQATFYKGASGCEELLILDGASLSVSGSSPRGSKAVYHQCDDFEQCGPLGSIPIEILKIIGKQEWAESTM